MTADIKPETVDLANKLKKLIKIDPKTTVANTAQATIEDGAYLKHLPEGVTEDHVKALSKYNISLVAASGLALGELAIPVMKKNSEIDKVELKIPMTAGDFVDLGIQRHKMVNSPNAEPVERFGYLTTGLTLRATKSSGSQLTAVKTMLFGIGAEALGKK